MTEQYMTIVFKDKFRGPSMVIDQERQARDLAARKFHLQAEDMNQVKGTATFEGLRDFIDIDQGGCKKFLIYTVQVKADVAARLQGESHPDFLSAEPVCTSAPAASKPSSPRF